jgi:hypothetical protein
LISCEKWQESDKGDEYQVAMDSLQDQINNLQDVASFELE